MTVDEVLDQVRALLQQRGRVTYRSLKRRFDLDDEYLEDLKGELIHAEGVAVDEDGDVLVWTSGARGAHGHAEEQLRRLCAERGRNWESMSEEERETFIDDLVQEDRSCL